MASRRRQRGPRRPRLHLGPHRRVTPASTTRNRTRCRDSDDDDDGPPTNRARANSRPRRPRLHIGPDFLFTDRAGRRRGRAGRREGRGDLAGRALSIMTFGPQKLPEITKVMGISGNFPVITDPDFHYQEIGHPYESMAMCPRFLSPWTGSCQTKMQRSCGSILLRYSIHSLYAIVCYLPLKVTL